MGSDAETLAAFAATTFRETYSSNNDSEEVERHIALHFTVPRISGEIADPRCWTLLAFNQDVLVGYATLHARTPPPCVQKSSPIELARIYLARHEIGKGHGAALLRACLEEGRRRGFRTMWLSVWDENRRACAFYEKWGFQRVGTFEFVLGGKAYDDLVMARPIEEKRFAVRVSYAIVFVSDMKRSVSFYRDVMGIPLRFESPAWTEFETEGATLALHAADNPSSDHPSHERERPGRCRPGFRVPNLAEFHKKMVEKSVRCVQEPKDIFGVSIAQYVDPDGLVISVAEGGAS